MDPATAMVLDGVNGMIETEYPEYMPNTFQSQKDLYDRLNETICRYRSEPVFVAFDTANSLYLYSPDRSTIIKQIRPDDPDLDISSIELGYINIPDAHGVNRVYYTKRKVTKSPYKQGLHKGNIIIEDILGTLHGNVIRGTCPLYSNTIQALVKNDYPKFTDVFKTGYEDVEVAVSKELAFKGSRTGLKLVFHRGKNVGYMHRETDLVFVHEGELKFITEKVLRSHGLNVA